MSSEVRGISLHKLVRSPSHCTYAQQLLDLENSLDELEMLPRTRPYETSQWYIKANEYWELLKTAEKEVVSQAHVVMATCVGSGSPHVRDTLGGSPHLCAEVLIDEC